MRVWQEVESEKHEIGCSTERSPSELFIKAHKKRYMTEEQKEPLLEVVRGGTKCTEHDDCGSLSNGICSEKGICICNKGFVGSSCLTYDGYDENPFNAQQMRIEVSAIQLSDGFLISFGVLVLGLVVTLFIIVSSKSKLTGQKYNPIPDGDYSKDAHVILKQQRDEISQRSYCMIDGRLID